MQNNERAYSVFLFVEMIIVAIFLFFVAEKAAENHEPRQVFPKTKPPVHASSAKMV